MTAGRRGLMLAGAGLLLAPAVVKAEALMAWSPTHRLVTHSQWTFSHHHRNPDGTLWLSPAGETLPLLGMRPVDGRDVGRLVWRLSEPVWRPVGERLLPGPVWDEANRSIRGLVFHPGGEPLFP